MWAQHSFLTAGAAAKITQKQQTKALYFFDPQLGLPVGTFEGGFSFSFAETVEIEVRFGARIEPHHRRTPLFWVR